jgi:hypothetical protein
MAKKKPVAPDPLHDRKLLTILGGAAFVVLLIYVLSELGRV